MESRYQNRLLSKHDHTSHPFPFLSDGHGTGKSRFLQELSGGGAFKRFVLAHDAFPGLVNVLANALFINVSFGSDTETPYDPESYDTDILNGLRFRVLRAMGMDTHQASMALLKSSNSCFLSSFFNSITPIDCSSIILTIDNVENIHNQNAKEFNRIIGQVASLTRTRGMRVFFAAIVAGTVTYPIQYATMNHSFVRLRLSYLSFESCLEILLTKAPWIAPVLETDDTLRGIVADIGGYPLGLEILYTQICQHRDLIASRQEYGSRICEALKWIRAFIYS